MTKKKTLTLVLSCAAAVLPLALFGCGEASEDAAFGEWVTTVEASCEREGVQTRVSLLFPDVTETRPLAATGHDWNEWEVLVAPTCMTEGTETRACKTCDNLDYRPIAATGHEWGEWQTEREATCDDPGYLARACVHDGNHKDYQIVPATGHDWSDWVVTLAPGCVEEGAKTRYCRNCNRHTETAPVDSYGHDWSDWLFSKAPTELEDGEEIRICRNDGNHTQTRAIPALGHAGLNYTLNKEGTAYSVSGVKDKNMSGTVVIPATYRGIPVTEMKAYAFNSCPNIEEIRFAGNNLLKISGRISQCQKLQRVEFPEGLTEMDNMVFINCPALQSVFFPSTLLSFSKNGTSGLPIFMRCPALEEIIVDEGNKTYHSDGGCLIETATNTMIAGTNSCTIPEYVTSIIDFALFYSKQKTITIPAGVTSIGRGVFYNWQENQTIIVKGFASAEEAREAWGGTWLSGCRAQVIYEGKSE